MRPKTIIVDIMPEFKPGDPAPRGYLEWHEWAEVQTAAGIEQQQCPTCKRWQFPQEVAGHRCGEGKT